MKVADIHNFIKKYNHIFKISGYSTMKKEDKIKLIEDKIKTIGKLDQSIKKEWEGYKSTGKMSKAFSDASMTASNYETEKKKRTRKKKVVKPTTPKPTTPKPTFTTSNKKPEKIQMSKKPSVNTMKIDDNNKYKSKLTKSLEAHIKKLNSEPKPKKEKEYYDGEHIYWETKGEGYIKMTLTQFMAEINSLGLKWSTSQLSKVRNNYFMQPARMQNPKWKKEEQVISVAKYLYENQQNQQSTQSELDRMKADGVDMTKKYLTDRWMNENVFKENPRKSPQVRYGHSKQGYYVHTFNTSNKPKMPYSEIKDRLTNKNGEGLEFSNNQVFKDFNVEMYTSYFINMNKYNEGVDSYVVASTLSGFTNSNEYKSLVREKALYWKEIDRIIKDVDNWQRVNVTWDNSANGNKIILTPVYFRRSDIDEKGMAVGSWAKDIAVIKLVFDAKNNPEKTIQPVPDIKKQKQSVVNREVSIYTLGTYFKTDDDKSLSEIRNYSYYVFEQNPKKLKEYDLKQYKKYENLSDKAKELLATILDKLKDYEQSKKYNSFNSQAKTEIIMLITMIRKIMKQSGAKTNNEKSKPEVPYSSANAMYKDWFKSIRDANVLKPEQDISPYVNMKAFVDWASIQPWYPDKKEDQDAMKVGMANEVKKYHDKLNEKNKQKSAKKPIVPKGSHKMPDGTIMKDSDMKKKPAKAPAKKVEKKMQKKEGLKTNEIFQDTIDEEKVFSKSEITGFKELGTIFKVGIVDKLLKAITNNTARLYVKKYINELRNVYDASAKWKSGYKTLYNKLIKAYNTKILKKS